MCEYTSTKTGIFTHTHIHTHGWTGGRTHTHTHKQMHRNIHWVQKSKPTASSSSSYSVSARIFCGSIVRSNHTLFLSICSLSCSFTCLAQVDWTFIFSTLFFYTYLLRSNYVCNETVKWEKWNETSKKKARRKKKSWKFMRVRLLLP